MPGYGDLICDTCERDADRLYTHTATGRDMCDACVQDFVGEPDPGPEDPSPEEVERAFLIVQRAAAALDPPAST